MNKPRPLSVLPFVLALVLLFVPACTAGAPRTPFTEPAIPASYTTFTSEANVFSISYPPHWEPLQSILADIQAAARDYVNNLSAGVSLDKVTMLFAGGLTPSYAPNVIVSAEPVPFGVLTHGQLVAAQIKGLKVVAADYRQVARTETVIGGREATLLEYEASIEGQTVHNLAAIIKDGKNAWSVSCNSTPADFPIYQEELEAIARSFRLL